MIETSDRTITKSKLLLILCNNVESRLHMREVCSLDGPREVHDSVRGTGTFDKTMQAISILKKHNIPILTETVIHGKNYNCLSYVTGLAKKLNLYCSFSPLHNYDYSGSTITKDLPFEKEISTAVDFLIEEKKTNEYILNSSKGLDYLYESYSGRRKKLRCYAGTLYCSINPDGSLSPCFRRTDDVIKAKGSFRSDFLSVKEKVPKYRCMDCNFVAQVEYSLMNVFDLARIVKLARTLCPDIDSSN